MLLLGWRELWLWETKNKGNYPRTRYIELHFYHHLNGGVVLIKISFMRGATWNIKPQRNIIKLNLFNL